jgi:hypothetical protein
MAQWTMTGVCWRSPPRVIAPFLSAEDHLGDPEAPAATGVAGLGIVPPMISVTVTGPLVWVSKVGFVRPRWDAVLGLVLERKYMACRGTWSLRLGSVPVPRNWDTTGEAETEDEDLDASAVAGEVLAQNGLQLADRAKDYVSGECALVRQSVDGTRTSAPDVRATRSAKALRPPWTGTSGSSRIG